MGEYVAKRIIVLRESRRSRRRRSRCTKGYLCQSCACENTDDTRREGSRQGKDDLLASLDLMVLIKGVMFW
jgi:hypothetical protein